MTFFNETTLTATFSVNWNAVKQGSVTVAPGQNGQVGCEIVGYHIQAVNAETGQFLAENNGIYGNKQVVFSFSEQAGYTLAPRP
jgi:hypothetical protein